MSYGDYSGPDKPDKGKENGSCNRSACQTAPAIWFNWGSMSWYCEDCKRELKRANQRTWDSDLRPIYGHDMFETRQMITERKTPNQ